MVDFNELQKQYFAERVKWKKAGMPMRSAEEMGHIYNNICSQCPFFMKDSGWLPGYSRCGICNCNLHPSATNLNKLAWETTKCPHDPPKWGHD